MLYRTLLRRATRPDRNRTVTDERPDTTLIIGNRALTADDLATLTGTRTHYVIWLNTYTGYEIDAIHEHDECVDSARYYYYYARAVLKPPFDGQLGNVITQAAIRACPLVPLVTTCDLLDGELLTDANMWDTTEDIEHEHLSNRGIARLQLILNDLTEETRLQIQDSNDET
jgi:hypothetical protein